MVSETLLLLQLEHRNFADLLSLMDEQVELINGGSAPDIDVLRATVEYFSDFPDQCHHPKENLIFTKLVEIAPRAGRELAALLSEHAQLAVLTDVYTRAVDDYGKQADGALSLLRESMLNFISYHRDHMHMEEAHFFPAAIKHLSSSDWAEIDFALLDRRDPLFDNRRHRFQALQAKITALAEPGHRQSTAHIHVENHAHILASLHSIEAFNLWANRLRDRFYLVRYNSGEYGLEDDSEVIMAIPACSEERAIWCAYFYMIGYSSPD